MKGQRSSPWRSQSLSVWAYPLTTGYSRGVCQDELYSENGECPQHWVAGLGNQRLQPPSGYCLLLSSQLVHRPELCGVCGVCEWCVEWSGRCVCLTHISVTMTKFLPISKASQNSSRLGDFPFIFFNSSTSLRIVPFRLLRSLTYLAASSVPLRLWTQRCTIPYWPLEGLRLS